MPAEPKIRVIVDILEEHLEELSFLWMQRREALHSPDYCQREVAELEERIEAHLQGLLVGGNASLPFIEQALSEDDTFAAAYTLLRLDTDESRQRFLYAFREAEGEAIGGFCQALCQKSPLPLESELIDAVDHAPAGVAAAAAEVLAFHGKLEPRETRLTEFTTDENPQVRRRAWRIVSLLGQ